jgi:hypothetical protein
MIPLVPFGCSNPVLNDPPTAEWIWQPFQQYICLDWYHIGSTASLRFRFTPDIIVVSGMQRWAGEIWLTTRVWWILLVNSAARVSNLHNDDHFPHHFIPSGILYVSVRSSPNSPENLVQMLQIRVDYNCWVWWKRPKAFLFIRCQV